MIGLKTLHEHDGDIYTNALIATFTRLNIIKVNNLYNFYAKVALTSARHNCTLNNLNI